MLKRRWFSEPDAVLTRSLTSRMVTRRKAEGRERDRFKEIWKNIGSRRREKRRKDGRGKRKEASGRSSSPCPILSSSYLRLMSSVENCEFVVGL